LTIVEILFKINSFSLISLNEVLMCIEFVKPSGDYDFFSTPANLVANGILLTVVGLTAAAIVALALKALGYSGNTIRLGTAIPLAAGGIGIVALGAGSFALCSIICVIFSAVWRR
jgi:hypothetical protein